MEVSFLQIIRDLIGDFTKRLFNTRCPLSAESFNTGLTVLHTIGRHIFLNCNMNIPSQYDLHLATNI